MRSLMVRNPTLAPTVAAQSCALVGVNSVTSQSQRSRDVVHRARSADTSPRWQAAPPRRAHSADIPASAPAPCPGAPIRFPNCGANGLSFVNWLASVQPQWAHCQSIGRAWLLTWRGLRMARPSLVVTSCSRNSCSCHFPQISGISSSTTELHTYPHSKNIWPIIPQISGLTILITIHIWVSHTLFPIHWIGHLLHLASVIMYRAAGLLR
jgi:hypothetical protein